MTVNKEKKTAVATSFFFDWDKFLSTGMAELYEDTYYSKRLIDPERSSEPIVQGVTAFFCIPLGGEKPSLLQALKSNKPFSIDFYYNYYFDILYQVEAQKNESEPYSKRRYQKDL